MAADRAGPSGGRPVVDWEAAYAYYVSLPDPQRTYQLVADHFGISVRTVEKHGRAEGWKQRLGEVKRTAAESADARLAEQRAAKQAEIDLLIDASLTSYAQQLRNGNVKVSPSDLLRLYKLRGEVWDDTDTATSKHAARQSTVDGPVEDPRERTRQIVRALHEAGAFQRLQTLYLEPEEETL